MKIGFGHMAIRVKDMEASLAFYVGVLGFQKAFSMEKDGKPWYEYIKVADGQFLELFYGGNGEGVSPSGAFAHLCFAVDDIHAAAARVEAAGCYRDTPPRKGANGCLLFFTVDPDGIAIELMQVTPDSLPAQY